MDVSGRILRAWMPAIHAGMTEAADRQKPRRTLAVVCRKIPPFSFSVGERKIMDHVVASPSFRRLERLQHLERLEPAQRGHF